MSAAAVVRIYDIYVCTFLPLPFDVFLCLLFIMRGVCVVDHDNKSSAKTSGWWGRIQEEEVPSVLRNFRAYNTGKPITTAVIVGSLATSAYFTSAQFRADEGWLLC